MKVLTDAVVQSIQIENGQVHCVVETANDIQTLVLTACFRQLVYSLIPWG